MGIPLIEGRFLEEADNHREPRVCVVDRDFAQRYWPGKSALGRRIVNGPVFEEKKAVTIVGVVDNIKQDRTRGKECAGRDLFSLWQLLLQFLLSRRTHPDGPEGSRARAAEGRVEDRSRFAGRRVEAHAAWIDDSMVSRRSPALLAGLFAGVALVAGGHRHVWRTGLRRQPASPRESACAWRSGRCPSRCCAIPRPRGETVAGGHRPRALGAWGVGRAMQSMLFGVGTVHAGVLAGAAVVMTIVVLAATFLPSHRASRVSPIEALRVIGERRGAHLTDAGGKGQGSPATWHLALISCAPSGAASRRADE